MGKQVRASDATYMELEETLLAHYKTTAHTELRLHPQPEQPLIQQLTEDVKQDLKSETDAHISTFSKIFSDKIQQLQRQYDAILFEKDNQDATIQQLREILDGISGELGEVQQRYRDASKRVWNLTRLLVDRGIFRINADGYLTWADEENGNAVNPFDVRTKQDQ